MGTLIRQCPNCRFELDIEKHGKIEIDRCGECGDLWFDRTELAAYVAQRGPAAASVDWGTPVERPSGTRPNDCPSCRRPTLAPYEWEGIEFHRCSRCSGVHVSSSELEQLITRADKRRGLGAAKAIVGDTFDSVMDLIADAFK